MLSILLVLCLTAYGVSGDACCSFGDGETVKAQWNAFWNTADSSAAKLIFGREVFARLFEVDPDSKAIFTHLHVDNLESPEFSGHTLRVFTGLDLIINLLGEQAEESELYHVNEQHQMREQVRAHHFTEIFKILDVALSQVLENYDRLAWKFCMRGVRDILSHDLPA
jgi:hypothetical protein